MRGTARAPLLVCSSRAHTLTTDTLSAHHLCDNGSLLIDRIVFTFWRWGSHTLYACDTVLYPSMIPSTALASRAPLWALSGPSLGRCTLTSSPYGSSLLWNGLFLTRWNATSPSFPTTRMVIIQAEYSTNHVMSGWLNGTSLLILLSKSNLFVLRIPVSCLTAASISPFPAWS